MIDRLIKLIKEGEDITPCVNNHEYNCKGKKCRDCERKGIAKYLLANGVIVMPCKVGDTLYVNFQYLRSWENKTYPVTVNAIRLDTKKNNHRICVNGTFHLSENYSHNYMATFNFDNIGKTIFRTREEAEKALAERSAK